MGYTLLALAGNRHEIANERLREIRISPPVYWTLSMATRKNSKRSIAVTELSREIKSTVRHMVERGELRGRILRKQGAASFRPRSGPR
jgi:hypothetical protein